MSAEGRVSRAPCLISHIARGPADEATPKASALKWRPRGRSTGSRSYYSSFRIMDSCYYSHRGASGTLFGVSGNVTALHRPYRAVPLRSAFFSTSLHIMTPAAEKAPLLPHCTAFIPLEKQRRRIYKRRKSPPWAQRELPSPLGQFFLQDGAWRAIIFKLAHQAPSNLPLCEQAKARRRMRRPCAGARFSAPPMAPGT